MIEKKNKAALVREALCLTPTQAGTVLLGHAKKPAYDIWSAMERPGYMLSAGMNAYLDLLLFLATARDLNTREAGKALDLYLDFLWNNNDHYQGKP